MKMEIKFPFTLPELPKGAKWLTVSAIQWVGGSKNYYTKDARFYSPDYSIHQELESIFNAVKNGRVDNVDLSFLNQDDTIGTFERITPEFLLP